VADQDAAAAAVPFMVRTFSSDSVPRVMEDAGFSTFGWPTFRSFFGGLGNNALLGPP